MGVKKRIIIIINHVSVWLVGQRAQMYKIKLLLLTQNNKRHKILSAA